MTNGQRHWQTVTRPQNGPAKGDEIVIMYGNVGDSDDASSGDPSRSEIGRRAAEIRRGWSESKRRRRRVGKPPRYWLPPLVEIEDLMDEPPSAQGQ
ncbi:MAG: hypothetical protein KDA60_12290 [Planctomycetales bacterium]|nr:hypothetical protein [Planctomycetales bacterium]